MFAEKCQWCNQEKVELPERTEKKGLPVFVCAKAVVVASAAMAQADSSVVVTVDFMSPP